LSGQALRSTGVTDETGVMLTSENSGVETLILLESVNFIFDYGEIEPDEVSVASGVDAISCGWVRIRP